MSDLEGLRPHPGARKKPKRVGRGPGSGQGKTSGRGTKGYKSRAGGNPHPWYEGGQMPLVRRLPKRGFHNPFRVEFALIKVGDLERFEEGSVVDIDALKGVGLIGKRDKLIKLLGNGELQKPLTVKVHKVSRGARVKLEAAGGSWLEVGP